MKDVMALVGEHDNDGVDETEECERGYEWDIYLVQEACCASSGE